MARGMPRGKLFWNIQSPNLPLSRRGRTTAMGIRIKNCLRGLPCETGAVIVRTDGERMRIKGFLGD